MDLSPDEIAACLRRRPDGAFPAFILSAVQDLEDHRVTDVRLEDEGVRVYFLCQCGCEGIWDIWIGMGPLDPRTAPDGMPVDFTTHDAEGAEKMTRLHLGGGHSLRDLGLA